MISRLVSTSLILFAAGGLLGSPGITNAEDPTSTPDEPSTITSIRTIDTDTSAEEALPRSNRQLQRLRSQLPNLPWLTRHRRRRRKHQRRPIRPLSPPHCRRRQAGQLPSSLLPQRLLNQARIQRCKLFRRSQIQQRPRNSNRLPTRPPVGSSIFKRQASRESPPARQNYQSCRKSGVVRSKWPRRTANRSTSIRSNLLTKSRSLSPTRS